jgi:hypothetical protein
MRKSTFSVFILCCLFAQGQVTNTVTLFDYFTKTPTSLWGACNGCPNIAELTDDTHWVAGIPEENTHFYDFGNDGTNVWATSVGIFYRIYPNRGWRGFTTLTQPWYLAFDGAEVWVSSHDTVSHVDSETGAVLSFIKVGETIQDLRFDNQHNLWVLLYSGSIVKYPPGATAYSASIPVGANASYLRYDIGYDGATLWVSSPSGITRIDPITNAVVGSYPTIGTRFAFDGSAMWLLTPGGFSRLNNSGVPTDTYSFVNGHEGTDIILDGAVIRATNASFMMTVPLAGLAPLPVKFTLLNSSCTGSSVVIHFSSEGRAVKSYRVEKSSSGSKWETLGTLAPNASGSYQITDRNVSSPSLYRILEIDLSDHVYMSTILKSLCDQPATYAIFPNPARNQTTINVFANSIGRGLIRVYNSDGQLIISFDREILQGENQIPLDVSLFPTGPYQIITTWGGNLKSAGFVKQ